jgi:hypothetical protein
MGSADELSGLRRPPDNMLPAIVPAGQLLVRTERLIIALSHLAVYPGGCVLELLGSARGREASFDDFSRLVFTVQFGTERASLYDKTAPQWRPDGSPALLLTPCGMEGSQTDQLVDVRLPLWLSPLPPLTPGTLTLARRDPRVGSASCPLDGRAIAAAARGAQPYW